MDEDTYRRALVWYGTFALEQVAAALDGGVTGSALSEVVDRAASWLAPAAPAYDALRGTGGA